MTDNNHHDWQEQLERLLREGQPASDNLLNDLASTQPQARPEFQRQLEERLVMTLHAKSHLRSEDTMQSISLPNDRHASKHQRRSLPVTLAAAMAIIIFGGLAIIMTRTPQGESGPVLSAAHQDATSTALTQHLTATPVPVIVSEFDQTATAILARATASQQAATAIIAQETYAVAATQHAQAQAELEAAQQQLGIGPSPTFVPTVTPPLMIVPTSTPIPTSLIQPAAPLPVTVDQMPDGTLQVSLPVMPPMQRDEMRPGDEVYVLALFTYGAAAQIWSPVTQSMTLVEMQDTGSALLNATLQTREFNDVAIVQSLAGAGVQLTLMHTRPGLEGAAAQQPDMMLSPTFVPTVPPPVSDQTMALTFTPTFVPSPTMTATATPVPADGTALEVTIPVSDPDMAHLIPIVGERVDVFMVVSDSTGEPTTIPVARGVLLIEAEDYPVMTTVTVIARTQEQAELLAGLAQSQVVLSIAPAE